MRLAECRCRSIPAVLAAVLAVGCSDRRSLNKLRLVEWGSAHNWDRAPEAVAPPEALYGRWLVTRVEGAGWGFDAHRPAEFVITADPAPPTVERDDGDPCGAGPSFPPIIHVEPSSKSFELTGSDQTVRGILKLLADGRLIVAFGREGDEFGEPAGFDARYEDVLVLVCERVPSPPPVHPLLPFGEGHAGPVP